MVQRRINARDIIVQASDGDPDEPTWIEVGGLISATVNPGENVEETDVTDFDSEGAFEGEIMQRGSTLALEGRLKADDVTGALEPGQAQVTTNASPDALAVDSLAEYRFRYPTDTQWRQWTATTVLTEQGGGTNDKVSFGATIRRSGRPTTAPVT